MAITDFMAQFTHVSRHFVTQKNVKENCFENVVSEIYKKNLFGRHNPPMIVNVFMFFCFYFCFNLLHFFLKLFVGHIGYFCLQIWDHTFKTVFPKQFVLFSIVNFKISRNMCKLCNKSYHIEFQMSSISNLGFQI